MITSEKFSKALKNDAFILFLVFFAAYALKYLIYGFTYFPILDDYIQYGGYPLYGDNSYVLFDIGTVKTRPLASVLDIFFWGNVWDKPVVSLLITMLMQLLSCIIFFKTAKNFNIRISPVFFIIYLLAPIGSEASYWLSASSRIITGLFFMSVSAYALSNFIKNEKKKICNFLIFAVFFTLACGLYEAVAVFGFVLCLGLIFFSKSRKGILPVLFIIFALTAAFLYPIFAKDIGRMGSRAGGFSIVGVAAGIDDMLIQTVQTAKNSVCDILIKGFASGIGVLMRKGIPGILYILLCFGISTLTGMISCTKKENILYSKKENISVFIFGLLLLSAPLAPNILTDTVWITYRSLFISLIGVALILDRLLLMIKSRAFIFIFTAALSFICIVSCINEYDTYKRTYEADSALLSSVAQRLDSEVLCGEKNAVIYMQKKNEISQVGLYKDHVKSVFSADWSLTGALRCTLSDINIKLVTPVYPSENFEINDEQIIDLR